MSRTQRELVLSRLLVNGSITQRDAIEFGCYRLAPRILELRQEGHKIRTDHEPHDGGTHARYVYERGEQLELIV